MKVDGFKWWRDVSEGCGYTVPYNCGPVVMMSRTHFAPAASSGSDALKSSMLSEVLVLRYSRSLCPGGVLFELAVVDGEVRPEVTAVTQRRDTTAEKETEKHKHSTCFRKFDY